MKTHHRLTHVFLLLSVLCLTAMGALAARSAPAFAAGGELYVAATGSDSNPGTSSSPLRTVQKALDLVQPGGHVVLRGGTYQQGAASEGTAAIYTRRSGTAAAPITIRSYPGERATLRGYDRATGRLFQINGKSTGTHDYYVIDGITFTHSDKLLWIKRGNHNVIRNSSFTDAGSECVRIKDQSTYNTFSGNTVGPCGVEKFGKIVDGKLSKNGEGVYIGTAPEQRYRNLNEGSPPAGVTCSTSGYTCVPDKSHHNLVENSTIDTRTAEAVEFKEDAEYNTARGNTSLRTRDTKGGSFGARGDYNTFEKNVAKQSSGSGFRTGGDTVSSGIYDQAATRTYGKNNSFRGNHVDGAGVSGGIDTVEPGHAYKFVQSPQDVDCSNTGVNYTGKLYSFENGSFTIKPCAPSNTLKFAAAADARVEEASPTTNYGASTTLRADGGTDPDVQSYLRFVVSGVSGTVLSARLRLYVSASTANGPALFAASNDWTETGISWGNRPGPVGAASDNKAGISSSAWVEFDVAPLLSASGNGTYSFVLMPESTDGLDMHSREGTNKPQLVVTYDPAASPATGAIGGAVTDAVTGGPIAGATVSYGGGSATTDAAGVYTLPDVAIGTHTVTAGATAYGSQSAIVTVTSGSTTAQSFALTVAPPPPATPTTLEVSPEADARVEEASPSTNYGASTTLRADGASDPDVQSYLRFTVSGATGTVQSAKLRLYTSNGTANGPAVYAAANSTWSETTVTWSNRPGPTGSASDNKASIGSGVWVEYDVKPLLAASGNGTYSFVLMPESSDGVELHAREGANKPQLVVTLGG